MWNRLQIHSCVRVAVLASAWAACALPSVATAEPLTFERHVRPILKTHCFQCHGEEPEKKGGLDVRLARLLASGGESGPAVVAGDSGASLLIRRIVSGEMPPGNKPVPSQQLEVLRSWIDQGAHTAAIEPDDPARVEEITAEDRAYWCFQPLRRPEPPVVRAQERVANPIDAFLLSKLEPVGLSFAPEADRRVLIRRVCFDLLGLPPAPERIEAFVADPRADAYALLVEELLASPHYGERWGRHWLDVAGYADSDGYTPADPVRPDIYRYRDYVIRSLNADKPFDRFIVEQLAGDELVPLPYGPQLTAEQQDCLIATGYLRLAPDGTANGEVDQTVARNDVIAETIKIVSNSFLGLTVGCAQCHSHRYDPITQVDYYKLRAVFEPAYNWKAWRTPEQRKLVMTPEEVQAEIKRISDLVAVKQKEYIDYLNAECDRVRELEFQKIPEDKRAIVKMAFDTKEADRTDEQKLLAKEFYNYFNVNTGTIVLFDPKVMVEGDKRTNEIKELSASKPSEHVFVVLTEPANQPVPETFVFQRGNPATPREAVLPGDLSIVEGVVPSRIEPKDPQLPTSGRRLALARHLTSGQHPLTSRVLVNRFWMHHFGKGIVATPGDFGRLGAPPSHPELLDWLASEFIAQGWSLKAFHRLVLLSQAYRQSSARTTLADNIDPDNRLLSHMSLRRLEAEAIRDAMLVVSGKWNPTLLGPAIPVAENEHGEVIIGIEFTDGNGIHVPKPVPNGGEFRRSLYIQSRRTKPLSLMETFDWPMMEPNCEVRNCSTIPQQSLSLMNAEGIRKFAQSTAERIVSEVGSDPSARVDRAWRLVLGRMPRETERTEALAFIDNQQASLTAQPVAGTAADMAALTTLIQVLFGGNEFLYVE